MKLQALMWLFSIFFHAIQAVLGCAWLLPSWHGCCDSYPSHRQWRYTLGWMHPVCVRCVRSVSHDTSRLMVWCSSYQLKLLASLAVRRCQLNLVGLVAGALAAGISSGAALCSLTKLLDAVKPMSPSLLRSAKWPTHVNDTLDPCHVHARLVDCLCCLFRPVSHNLVNSISLIG